MKTQCTLRSLIRRNIELNPDKPALIEGGRGFTFRQFADRTYRMGNALLALGLEPGDRVAILGHNSIENAESYFSIPNAGLVLVMLNFRLAPAEILTILEDSTPRAVMVHAEYMDRIKKIKDDLTFVEYFIYIDPPTEDSASSVPDGWLQYEDMIETGSPEEPSVKVTEDALATLMYTSGTTGAPKGCMASHLNFYHAGRSMTLEMRMDENDVGVIASPLFHATGEVTLMNHMYSGTTSVILPQWNVETFLSLVEKYKITTGMLATPMVLFLVEYPNLEAYDHSSLKKMYFAGAPVSPPVFEKAIKLFGNIFIHLFGTSETVGQATILKLSDVAGAIERGKPEILGSCGRSFADMEAQVVDEQGRLISPGEVGEIRIRGLGTTMGYWNKERETRQVFRDGWYYPLDMCRIDEDGYIYVVDRKKDMIITGGENVYPAEVENVLYRHEAVLQVAVIGLPDEKWGERVVAVVVRRPGTEATEEDVRNFCNDKIARYKIPKQVIFTESLPMSASGKILKYKLRSELN